MARVNVYLPDDLAKAARAAALNISSLTQEAIRRQLQANGIGDWLKEVRKLEPSRVSHQAVLDAIDAACDELGSTHG